METAKDERIGSVNSDRNCVGEKENLLLQLERQELNIEEIQKLQIMMKKRKRESQRGKKARKSQKWKEESQNQQFGEKVKNKKVERGEVIMRNEKDKVRKRGKRESFCARRQKVRF